MKTFLVRLLVALFLMAAVSLPVAIKNIPDFRSAIRIYSDILLLEPDDETAYTQMGQAYLVLGDIGRAHSAFRNALYINPENAIAALGIQKIMDPDGMEGMITPNQARGMAPEPQAELSTETVQETVPEIPAPEPVQEEDILAGPAPLQSIREMVQATKENKPSEAPVVSTPPTPPAPPPSIKKPGLPKFFKKAEEPVKPVVAPEKTLEAPVPAPVVVEAKPLPSSDEIQPHPKIKATVETVSTPTPPSVKKEPIMPKISNFAAPAVGSDSKPAVSDSEPAVHFVTIDARSAGPATGFATVSAPAAAKTPVTVPTPSPKATSPATTTSTSIVPAPSARLPKINGGSSVPKKLSDSGPETVTFEQCVQIALKNAGFYNGAIDGRVGSTTETSIRKFQRQNSLKEDGKVGPKTWAKLEPFLNKDLEQT